MSVTAKFANSGHCQLKAICTSSLNPISLSARSVPPAARVLHLSCRSCELAISFSRVLALSLVAILPSRTLYCDGLRECWILIGRAGVPRPLAVAAPVASVKLAPVVRPASMEELALLVRSLLPSLLPSELPSLLPSLLPNQRRRRVFRGV